MTNQVTVQLGENSGRPEQVELSIEGELIQLFLRNVDGNAISYVHITPTQAKILAGLLDSMSNG